MNRYERYLSERPQQAFEIGKVYAFGDVPTGALVRNAEQGYLGVASSKYSGRAPRSYRYYEPSEHAHGHDSIDLEVTYLGMYAE